MKLSKRVAKLLAEKTARMLDAARTRELPPHLLYAGEARLYCENSDCGVRTIIVHVKELPGEDVLPAELKCPACRNTLNCHGVLTAQQAREDFRATARRSVNGQRFERDHSRPGEPVAVPIGVLLDDSLPA